jgi:hypothetical protein
LAIALERNKAGVKKSFKKCREMQREVKEGKTRTRTTRGASRKLARKNNKLRNRSLTIYLLCEGGVSVKHQNSGAAIGLSAAD